VSFDVLGLILQAGLIVKIVLLVLVMFSVISWAIIASKWWELRGVEQDSEAFLEIYHQEPFEEVYESARDLGRSPIALVFLAACSEMARLASRAGLSAVSELDPAAMRRVTKRISWSAAHETQRLDRGLPFLAMTGSSSVYIGLFGTVVGIVQAFQGIGASGNASLAVVAPGIAEALIATAVGLVAAIPATIFYNVFSARIDADAGSIVRFAEELEEDLSQLGASGAAAAKGPGPGARATSG
jgi:biopolymer transport protein TolQ